MLDHEILKKYMTNDSSGSNSHSSASVESEKEFADLLGRIPGKVKDLQNEIDDHDRIKKNK